jgi:hypothetical protein
MRQQRAVIANTDSADHPTNGVQQQQQPEAFITSPPSTTALHKNSTNTTTTTTIEHLGNFNVWNSHVRSTLPRISPPQALLMDRSPPPTMFVAARAQHPSVIDNTEELLDDDVDVMEEGRTESGTCRFPGTTTSSVADLLHEPLLPVVVVERHRQPQALEESSNDPNDAVRPVSHSTSFLAQYFGDAARRITPCWTNDPTVTRPCIHLSFNSLEGHDIFTRPTRLGGGLESS